MIWSEAETVMLAFGAAANAGYHQVPLILHYGELYNYFIIYHNVMLDSKEIQRDNHSPKRSRVSHNYTHNPSLLSLPLIPQSHSSRL